MADIDPQCGRLPSLTELMVSVGTWAWRTGGVRRGVVELGSVTASELKQDVRRHGGVNLRPRDAADARTEIYFAVRTAMSGPLPGRYQSIKIAIEPLRVENILKFRVPASNRANTYCRVKAGMFVPALNDLAERISRFNRRPGPSRLICLRPTLGA